MGLFEKSLIEDDTYLKALPNTIHVTTKSLRHEVKYYGYVQL